ncbi:MAG TPA: response regulator transcription factor [Acidobacteriota bacterium]|nr:response regulator transcription factor [Acidobacteriota bacterium]
MPKGTILVIDDERDLIELVQYILAREGFQVIAAADGEAGLELASRETPDLVLVDLMLPGIDGLEVCQRLRKGERTSNIPLIMLTAKSAESDRIVGLELGADDYVTKPFSPRELAARIKAVLRRSVKQKPESELLRRGSLSIDVARHEVTCADEPIILTATEFRLLHFIAARPGHVFSRDDIIDSVIGRDVTVRNRTIDVHVLSLRRKLGRCGYWIETVRGFGYKFREDQEEN